jgi:hypothetical protein
MTDALDLFDIFASDKESEEEGRWIELGGTALKIRAFGAKAVTDLRESLMKPYAQLLRVGGKIPDDKNEEIGLKVLAGAVIVGLEERPGRQRPEASRPDHGRLFSADEAYRDPEGPAEAGLVRDPVLARRRRTSATSLSEDGAGNS